LGQPADLTDAASSPDFLVGRRFARCFWIHPQNADWGHLLALIRCAIGELCAKLEDSPK
jgi:hypothetical protein